MTEQYVIQYSAENLYQRPVRQAYWQFLIIPEENENQTLVEVAFENSENAHWEITKNGFMFPVILVHASGNFTRIAFKATFKVVKNPMNPYDFDLDRVDDQLGQLKDDLNFKADHFRFLKSTRLSLLPKGAEVFKFNPRLNAFENLLELNAWVYKSLHYREGVTNVNTTLDQVLKRQEGVCQDFTHLFISIARLHGIPARYVSGYLHQGMGYFGDAQMHAWAEAFVPGIGWKGFDPTNNLLAASDHIKVAHGRDYDDCAPLKGVLIGAGENTTHYQVQVASQQ